MNFITIWVDKKYYRSYKVYVMLNKSYQNMRIHFIQSLIFVFPYLYGSRFILLPYLNTSIILWRITVYDLIMLKG